MKTNIYEGIFRGEGVECIVCNKIIKQLYPKTQDVIKIEMSHSLGGMWDDMGTVFCCSWDCYYKTIVSKNDRPETQVNRNSQVASSAGDGRVSQLNREAVLDAGSPPDTNRKSQEERTTDEKIGKVMKDAFVKEDSK